MNSDSLERNRQTLLLHWNHLDTKLQSLHSFIKAHEFNDPLTSHPYSFATYQTVQLHIQELKPVMESIVAVFQQIQSV